MVNIVHQLKRCVTKNKIQRIVHNILGAVAQKREKTTEEALPSKVGSKLTTTPKMERRDIELKALLTS